MAIEINENVLLTIAGVVFVPIFVFLIKMIMEVANIRSKLDTFEAHIDESKTSLKKIADFNYEMRAIKGTLADIDDDLKYLFNSVYQDTTTSRGEEEHNTFGSRRQFKKRGIGAAGFRYYQQEDQGNEDDGPK